MKEGNRGGGNELHQYDSTRQAHHDPQTGCWSDVMRAPNELTTRVLLRPVRPVTLISKTNLQLSQTNSQFINRLEPIRVVLLQKVCTKSLLNVHDNFNICRLCYCSDSIEKHNIHHLAQCSKFPHNCTSIIQNVITFELQFNKKLLVR